MARTIVFPTNVDHPGITENADGTRTLDLDLLFADVIESEKEDELEGKPTQTVKMRTMARIKLAANPQMVNSRFSAEPLLLHDYFSFGGWDENHFGRTEFRGPMVQGPYMYAFEHGTILSAHKEPDEHAYLVNDQDILIFMGHKFRATVSEKPRYPKGKFNLSLI